MHNRVQTVPDPAQVGDDVIAVAEHEIVNGGIAEQGDGAIDSVMRAIEHVLLVFRQEGHEQPWDQANDQQPNEQGSKVQRHTCKQHRAGQGKQACSWCFKIDLCAGQLSEER